MMYLTKLISIFIVTNNLNYVLSDNVFLNTNWTIQNGNASIQLENQVVPIGVYSALEQNGITGSVLYSKNDVNLRWISYDNWTFSTTFSLNPNILNRKQIILTLHGIDTISKITINDVELGKTDNMFVRYSFDIKPFVQSENDLIIEFTSPVLAALELSKKNNVTPPECPNEKYHGECHANLLRKMQASFSWDWGLAAPSMGIWKPVSIEYYDSAIIRDVNVILDNRDPVYWIVYARCYIEKGVANDQLKGKLTLQFPQTNVTNTTTVNTKAVNGEVIVDILLRVNKSEVFLWWPNGYGVQKMYNLRAVWESAAVSTPGEQMLPLKHSRSQKTIRIGFRTIQLIQEPAEKGLSFYFRVNDVNIFMKGSNWIPAHILPEQSGNIERIRHLLKSAKYVNMNMLRVWGGGIYEHDQFYELADTYGILIWQDMMFACAMYPVFPEFLASVREETKQNIRRLQSHPSIAIWAANNENEAALQQNWYSTLSEYSRFANEYRELYINVLKDEIEKNDKSRECLSSSPSNGKKTVTENWLSTDPQDWHFGDIHYYNYGADGWDPNIYPKPRFASEYGFQSYPAMGSWESILNVTDSLTALIPHRQHFPSGDLPIINLIGKHFNLPVESDPKYYDALIYMSQVSQAMTTKTETEVYRAERGGLMGTMGALYWQLNDVWVAPSWSSIDFYGQFKILHNWAKEFLAPVHVIAFMDKTDRIDIHVVRDEVKHTAAKYQIEILVFQYNNLAIAKYMTVDTEVEPNSAKKVATIQLSDILSGSLTKVNSFLEFRLKTSDNKVVARNYLFPEKILNAIGIVDPQVSIKIAAARCSLNVSHLSLQVKTNYPALFIYLQLKKSSAAIKHIFSKNGFIQTSAIQIVQLEMNNSNCSTTITESDFDIMTINQYHISQK